MSNLEENMEDVLNISAEPVEESKPCKPQPPKVDEDDREKITDIPEENFTHS
jgi:hypothetical protein